MPPPSAPCSTCGKPCRGRECLGCVNGRRGVSSGKCTPEMARAIVAILLADPGCPQVHGQAGDVRS